MARSSECTGQCALKVLDTADIVRDAIFRQLLTGASFRVADFVSLDLRQVLATTERLPRGKRIASRFGYLFARSQSEEMIQRITSSAMQSQLPSGPALPPVSQSGPENVGLNRRPLNAYPLFGTP